MGQDVFWYHRRLSNRALANRIQQAVIVAASAETAGLSAGLYASDMNRMGPHNKYVLGKL
jgi:hypothetical protein